jgi:hypothetical protein
VTINRRFIDENIGFNGFFSENGAFRSFLTVLGFYRLRLEVALSTFLSHKERKRKLKKVEEK